MEESHARRDSSINRDYLKVSGDLEVTKRQLDRVQSLCETQSLMIKRLQEELGEDAEYDPDDDPHVRRVRREYEQLVEDYEERIRQLESEQREDDDEQVERMRSERNRARNEAAEAREKMTLFNEQKRCKSQVQRLSSEVHRANQAMDKMRTEAVSMRSKLNDLRDERSSLKRRLETAGAEGQSALEERDASIANLRSLDLDGLEQSEITTQAERTRLQLHSTEMSVSMVSLRRELEESRVAKAAARVSE